MLLQHGWHLRGAGKGRPAAEDANLNTILTACALAMFATNLDFFALNLAIPGMARDLDESTTNMQWAISGFMLALGAFLIPGGRLGDLVGRRTILICGTGLFGLASLVGGLAPSAEFLIGAHLFQGIGAAIMFPVAIAVITNSFPEERRKRAIGNLYGLAAAATAVGPFVGGALTELLSWRWVLLVNVPGARSRRTRRAAARPPRTCPASRASSWPLIDLNLFRNRPYVSITLLGMTANIAFVVTTFAATLYLQDVRGYSPVEAGAASGVSLAIVIGAAGLCLAIAAALIEALTTATRPEGEVIEDLMRTLAIASVPIAAALALIGSRKRFA